MTKALTDAIADIVNTEVQKALKAKLPEPKAPNLTNDQKPASRLGEYKPPKGE